jgi:hypothetical protein
MYLALTVVCSQKVTGVDVANGIVHVKGLDLLDDTPVLDIKPYIPAFDAFPDARAGWMDMICDSVDESREKGYQDIHSARGARAARAAKRKLEEEKMQQQQQQPPQSVDTSPSAASSNDEQRSQSSMNPVDSGVE